MKKIPVIIDCDPGLDDVVALLVAGRNERIDLKAVTVVGGNQTLEKVGLNALKVLSLAGVDVPLAYGYAGPMTRELVMAPEVHGDDGIQGIELPQASLKASDLHAVDLLAHILRSSEQKVSLVAMGPLTNIAMFLKRYPELKEKIERISLMGGVINGGNCTPVAEFNIYVDPEAASIVFNSGLPITMSGLDVTHKAILVKEDIEEIRKIDNKVSHVLVKILEKILSFHHSLGEDECYLHDPVALLALSHPEIVKTKALRVDIELEGKFTRGMTVAHEDARFNLNPNADVVLDIDRSGFARTVIEAIKRY